MLSPRYADISHQFFSQKLNMLKTIHVFLPPDYEHTNKFYPLLILNDGQDAEALKIKENLQMLYKEGFPHLIVFAVCATERLHEYGTAGIPDYAGRGRLAQAYTDFLVKEWLPYAHQHYRTKKEAKYHAIAGSSLGGLSAFDIAWHHPEIFGKSGVFSGSLWWRKHATNDKAADIDRIIHEVVEKNHKKEGLKFWFEAGTEDEKEDRNNNGIIDAIDDTLDLIALLEKKGYDRNSDICYLEVGGGRHNHQTWAAVMPDFLRWAFA